MLQNTKNEYKPRDGGGHRPIIGFMSDLGTEDDSVGICKGVMLGLCPDAVIVDISHSMTPWDIDQGSRLIVDLPKFFPNWTTFATTSYRETGTSARSVAIKLPSGHVYVAPNNGLLTRVIEDHGYVEAYEVTTVGAIPAEPEPTWFSRDMVAYPAAAIAAGFPLENVGRPLNDSEIVRADLPRYTQAEDGIIQGIVTTIDRPFGNIWTNIPRRIIENELRIAYGTNIRVVLDNLLVLEVPFMRTFGDVGLKKPMCYINSRGYFSLAYYGGNLADPYNIRRGMPVKIESITR
ncbi:MAG: Chlorinase [Methanosaeta sp. PtaU1.Bin055]|nr:MAG: Chlorinase [Methanosaeta sp. PtaU1.Bin055]